MLQQELPRRNLLKAFASTGAFVLPAGFAIQATGCALFVADSVEDDLLVFNGQQARVLAAIAEACLPAQGTSDQVTKIVRRLDEELYFVSPMIREDFKLALDVMQYLPIAYGCFSRMTAMNPQDRVRFLTSVQHTRIEAIRAVVNACRMAIMISYYDLESSWSAIGYDGTFSGSPQVESVQRAHYRQRTTKATVGREERQ